MYIRAFSCSGSANQIAVQHRVETILWRFPSFGASRWRGNVDIRGARGRLLYDDACWGLNADIFVSILVACTSNFAALCQLDALPASSTAASVVISFCPPVVVVKDTLVFLVFFSVTGRHGRQHADAVRG